MEENTTLEEMETPTETPTDTEQETPTEISTEAEQETPTEAETENSETPLFFDSLPDNSENVVHEMFAILGVNLDYTPQNKFQCFTMGMQFIAAFFVIYMFLKYLFKVMGSFLSPKAW